MLFVILKPLRQLLQDVPGILQRAGVNIIPFKRPAERLGLAVGFGIAQPGEALIDVVLGTELHECMVLRIPFVILAVIGVVLLDGKGAFRLSPFFCL